VIQAMLRHAKQQTTARHIHAVNPKQLGAHGKYLDAIKIAMKHPGTGGLNGSRVGVRVGN